MIMLDIDTYVCVSYPYHFLFYFNSCTTLLEMFLNFINFQVTQFEFNFIKVNVF